MGKIASRIVTSVTTNPSNDLMEAVKHGSLYSDILGDSFRHQLLRYKIVSFYEGVGNVCFRSTQLDCANHNRTQIVSRESAVIGLPGNVEAQLQLNASHSDICRFDPSSERDQDNYKIVNSRLKGLYKEAILLRSKLANPPQQEALEERFAALSDPRTTSA